MLVVFWSCSTTQDKSPAEMPLAQEGLLATNWFQTSGEARALYLQGYYFARLSFNDSLKIKTKKPKAVIVDIDETIFDNSPYQAKAIQEKVSYPVYWKEWVETESAKALPGSLEFLKYVTNKGGVVFYVTNRKEEERAATYNNLTKLGFPIKDHSQLLTRVDKSDKSDRRALVKKTHAVVLLVGDNLNDFDGVFEKKSVAEKEQLVDKMKNDFGPKFIILPNPLYGDWEGALYDYNFKLSDQEKHEQRMKALESF